MKLLVNSVFNLFDFSGLKKKKKKKKSKRKHESDTNKSDNDEPDSKKKKLDKGSKDKSKDDTRKTGIIVVSFIIIKIHLLLYLLIPFVTLYFAGKSKSEETIKIKKEKDLDDESKVIEEKEDKKEGSPTLPPISKILDDDAEATEVPKFLG